MRSPASYDVIILGAGGAGLMCAGIAGQRGRRVLLVDHNADPGRKILISGGGRCNFTNKDKSPNNYLSNNMHFSKSPLARYSAQDFISLVDRHGIAWHEKTLGQLFCDGSARQIVDMLRAEARRGGVEECYASPVHEVSHADGRFTVRHGEQVSVAPALVIATGGLSIPKLGATGLAYDLARQFGLEVIAPRPALVPLTLSGDDALFTSLSGVAAPVVARTGKASFREAALFTHRGLSGPAILQVSSYWRPGEAVSIDFLPDVRPGWLTHFKTAGPRLRLARALGEHLPARLADALAGRLGHDSELANLPNRALEDAERRLAGWEFHPSGTVGFAKAEVTAGGIATSGLSSKTMAARSVPGLYAIGEAVDVTGWLGGYNFQWAWSSAVAAGEAV